MNILADIDPIDTDDENIILDTDESEISEVEAAEQEKESTAPRSDRECVNSMWHCYQQAKELLDRESKNYDPDKAEVNRDYEKTIAYLTAAAEHGNQYAEQLLHSIRSGRHWSAALGSLRLLQHISRIIQNRLEDERKEKAVVLTAS